ncbi:MAG: hypothetical protein KF836_07085 [Fimbriimonadaceae bacterium]|nr:hypothetical protein [Fimbriimonadaceae bacterium]
MKSAVAAISSGTLALLAHVPCCGPTVLFAFGGVSVGAGWLSVLEPIRYWLIGFSAISLGIGFWSAYRKPHACHECGTCQSEIHSKRRVRIGTMWFVAALVVSLTVVGLMNGNSHLLANAHIH